MRSVAILNELVDDFEKLRDRKQFENVLRDFSYRLTLVWKDVINETELVISDAIDLGFSRLSLEVVFKSLSHLEVQYVGRLTQLIVETDTLPTEFFETLDRLGVRLKRSVEILLKAIHLLYLYTYDTWFLTLNALLYALTRAEGSRKLYCLAAIARFLDNRPVEALALAAYAAELRVNKPKIEPWRNPEVWARSLLASYHLDVGIKVVREILAEYDFKEAFLER